MGYDVHITRAERWLDSKQEVISLVNWLKYVASDPEMRAEAVAVANDPGGKPLVAYESRGLAVWVAYSRHEMGGNRAWFDWYDGRIVVKNPDDEILNKMKQIAAHFAANVVGDDGELY